MKTFNRVASCLAVLASFALACSSATESTGGPTGAIGGATTVSGGSTGTQTTTGGTVTGNSGSSTGGAVSSTATGGMSSGGAGVGGASGSGGTSSATGGRATGGGTQTSSGGKATGGAAASTGGNALGGAAATGGSATGGATTSTGGKAIGGANNSTGGKAAGGASTSTGGSAVGGGSAGAAAVGGGSGDAVKSPGCGKATTLSGETTRTISVSGTNRTYIIRLPDNYDASHAYRMILSIHCLNGTAAGVASGSTGTNYQYYGLLKLAAGSMIFVAPQGINNSWPAGNVPFLKALITDLENNLCIDTSRVFAEGFSMGGSMSYALACEIPDMLRGIAVHSGGPMSGCSRSNKPVAYFMTHGINDSVCTYPGYGVPQIVDFAALNGCQAMDIPNTLKPTDTSGRTPVCGDYQGCSAGHPARACIFVGDHTPSPGGEATTWVPAETWKFISQF